MKFIKLIYWNELNLGDLLSPYIISKLSGLRIIHKDFYRLGIKGQILLLFKFLIGKVSKKDFFNTLFFFEKNLIGVGSVLAWGNKRSVIWGSGFMNFDENFRGGKLCAVRGKLTDEKLKKMGFNGCNIYGDPALLLPLLVSPSEIVLDEIAIIPHWSEFDFFEEEYGSKYKILDLRTANIEEFVKELTSCSFILSSSLHGIILSHAYGIPALWIKYGDIDTDGFKFYDYFSSVDIPIYEGICDYHNLLQQGFWKQLFIEYKKFSLPLKNIKLIQIELLKVAPFNLLPRYKLILS